MIDIPQDPCLEPTEGCKGTQQEERNTWKKGMKERGMKGKKNRLKSNNAKFEYQVMTYRDS